MPRPLVATAVLALTLSSALFPITGCSINPLTGRRELTLLSEAEEIELGRDLDREVVGSVGLYPDDRFQELVSRVGNSLAATSERPQLDWRFRVVDDAAVNAFAVPGGFIYVTRGLLTHLQSEAQLAAVLGHEIGHVSARHSINQISRAAVATTGAGLFRIIDPAGRHVGGAARRGVASFILRHSREDEIEADDLGVRYMQRTSTEPRAMYAVLETVANTSAAAGRQIPARASTHPDPILRRDRLVRSLGPAPETSQDEEFLRRLDGALFGQNALEGFMAGPRFVHPLMGIQADFPIGWRVSHDRTSAVTLSQDGEALVFLTPSEHESPAKAREAFFEQTGLEPGESWRTEINGMPASSNWFALDGQPTKFVGIAAFVQGSTRVFELFSLVTTKKAAEHGPRIEEAMLTLSPITSPAHRELAPMRIRIVRVEATTNLAAVAASHPSSVDLETLALINQVSLEQALPTGHLVKLVHGFNPGNLRPD